MRVHVQRLRNVEARRLHLRRTPTGQPTPRLHQPRARNRCHPSNLQAAHACARVTPPNPRTYPSALLPRFHPPRRRSASGPGPVGDLAPRLRHCAIGTEPLVQGDVVVYYDEREEDAWAVARVISDDGKRVTAQPLVAKTMHTKIASRTYLQLWVMTAGTPVPASRPRLGWTASVVRILPQVIFLSNMTMRYNTGKLPTQVTDYLTTVVFGGSSDLGMLLELA
jgi:hypothetical protein